MHCKHCGNQIENDSKFCSFCGGKIEPIGQTITTQQPLTQVQLETISTPLNEKSTSDDFTNALLVIGLTDFGFALFWTVLRIITLTTDNGYRINRQLEPVTTLLSIIHACIALFLCFLYTKKKEHKTLFLILTICLLAWYIYDNYLRSH